MKVLQYCIALLFMFDCSEAVAMGATGEECAPYFNSVFSSNKSIPAGLLDNEDLAIDCLVQALRKLSLDVISPEIEESKRGSLNRTSAALLKIVQKSGQQSVKEKAIEKIRAKDDISVATVLSFGARTNDRETRLNCAGLLSNIIDNSTVCVPLDHLADPALLKDEWGINGRANLLAVVSVVAPWAQKSNYNNMKELEKFLGNQLEGQADIQQTKNILINFSERLSFQDSLPNPNKNTDTQIMDECRKMPVKWANTPQFTLKYLEP